MSLRSCEDLARLRERLAAQRDPQCPIVTLCGGTGCRAKGSEAVYRAFEQELERQGLAARVGLVHTGCHGFCERGPLVVVQPQQILYLGVTPEDVPEIVAKTLAGGEPVERLLYADPETGARIVQEHQVPFYAHQQRVVLNQNGVLDPASIEDYVSLGGYGALARVLEQMTPEQVIEEVLAARLRGRGGAGFLTGTKWRLCRQSPGSPKYIICNADEGDPGAYMDRSLMEGNPHRVLEGMIIGAYATGASYGFVYIRNEYPLAVQHLRRAIRQATELGLLGPRILGSDFSLSIEIRLGSGAFVCGEETALMASIEGHAGEPRPRPPFPTTRGLWGCPTCINNVETWANVPLVLDRGAAWFSGLGSAESGGTKVFSLVGKVRNTGLVEVPMGATLGHIVMDIGGGIPKGKRFKAAQLGGPAGGCVPPEHLNVPVDYGSLREVGAVMGSGGMVICDEDTCMVDLARYFLKFTQEESCGKCLPCRVGTRAMLTTLERICRGEGREGDVEYLLELGQEVKRSALCGLGQNAPNPVLTMIQHFRPEFDAHVRDKRCPAGVCHDLVRAPCQNECPAGMDVPGYVALLGAGRPDEALAVALDTNPFPSVCGRVCHHPCEAKCRRGQMDEPVAIRALKRHIGQAARVRPSTLSRDGSAPVAIVGAGPAGLSCAYFLARLGHHPVVFEQMPMAGGLLAWGIPDYRLPKDVVRQEIAAIEALGVTIHTGVSIGRALSLSELGQRYPAVFLATGAQRSRRLGIEGEELPGVVPAVDWLRQVNLQPKSVEVGRRVVVVGGGNAAIDAARCALRLGAEEVTVLYRRSRAEMPALAEEVRAAEEEGVVVRPFVAPLRFSNDGGAPSLLCRTMAPGDFGADGRRQPVPIAGSEFTLAADLVLAAVGQQADLHCLGAEMAPLYSSGGSLSVDAHGRTALPWLFAGGDLASGPGTAIGAIAAGQRAALAIHRYLRPEDWSLPSWLVQRPVPVPFDPLAEPSTRRRAQPSELDPAQRRRSFAEVEGPLAAEVAVQEALRCLRCEYREGDGCHD